MDDTLFRGDRLRKLRLEKRYTHQELAELIGTSVRMISRYESVESGTSSIPTAKHIGRMADVFGVSADYLMGRTDVPEPIFTIDNLTQQERDVIRALRRGGVIEAIRVLVKPD